MSGAIVYSRSVNMLTAAPEYPETTRGVELQQEPGLVPATSQCLEYGVHSPNRMTVGKTKLTERWIATETQIMIRKVLEKSNMKM
jgi:hypothetical protein